VQKSHGVKKNAGIFDFTALRHCGAVLPVKNKKANGFLHSPLNFRSCVRQSAANIAAAFFRAAATI